MGIRWIERSEEVRRGLDEQSLEIIHEVQTGFPSKVDDLHHVRVAGLRGGRPHVLQGRKNPVDEGRKDGVDEWVNGSKSRPGEWEPLVAAHVGSQSCAAAQFVLAKLLGQTRRWESARAVLAGVGGHGEGGARASVGAQGGTGAEGWAKGVEPGQGYLKVTVSGW